MTKFAMGQAMRRREDDRFITGTGRYTDDINVPGQLYAYFVRSPHAHARIDGFDTAAAKAAPGVAAVFTGADLVGKAGTIPCLAAIPNKDGTPGGAPPRHILTGDVARHVGDPVAVVLAETLNQAKDAAELVEVNYTPLPAVVDPRAALAPGAPLVHASVPGNRVTDFEAGNGAKIAEIFASAKHVVELSLTNNRLIPNSMEPRVALAEPDAATGRITVHTTTQGVHLWRNIVGGMVLGMNPADLRVITTDVGGSFGMKAFIYPEPIVVVWAARELKRPVKWCPDRSEAFLSDNHGRDQTVNAALALDANGKFLGVRVETVANMGAYLSNFAPAIPVGSAGLHLGVYAIPDFHIQVKNVLTHVTPTDAYRGAGRPEAAYVIERLVERAAHVLGIAPDEIRRRNFIPTASMPYTNAAGIAFDSGDFPPILEKAKSLADVAGFAARRAASAQAGKLRGLGYCFYVEKSSGLPTETARISIQPDNKVTVITGGKASGQGHETAWAQVVADKLEVPFDSITVLAGDSDMLPDGGMTAGSAGLMLVGGAIGLASDDVVKKGKELAADALEVAVVDVEYGDGQFRVAGTDRRISIFDIAAKAMEKGQAALVGDGTFNLEMPSWPNGCHISEIEIDPETGVVKPVRHTVVDDFGRVMNPMIVSGQVHGGTVQGLGQAMGEHAVYDPDSGQLITGSFMDYWMPRADDMPSFTLGFHDVPSTTNPLGAKGCGEAGATGAPPAFVNAVIDALAPFGVTSIDMPVTQEKIWRITGGRRQAAE